MGWTPLHEATASSQLEMVEGLIALGDDVEIRDRNGDTPLHVAAANGHLDAAQLLELIRLRLEALRKLPDGVVEVVLAGESVAASSDQLRMFAEKPRRDLAAGTVLRGDDFVWLRRGSAPEPAAERPLGRRLARAVPAGDLITPEALSPRQAPEMAGRP